MAKATAKRHARLVVLIGMIMSLFSLLGCSLLFNAFSKEPDFDGMASRIVAAFEGNSVGPIEGILSQSALEADDLLDGISYGHELLAGGKVEKAEMHSNVEEDQFKNGKSDKSYSCLYDVYTNNGRYCLSLHFFSKNYIS